jgi:hypothetical protein
MLDLDGDLFPLGAAHRHYTGPPPRPHPSTFVRWALKGIWVLNGAGKERVRLETVKIGGRRYTSRAALERFVARLTGAAAAQVIQARRRTAEYVRAGRELDREGI